MRSAGPQIVEAARADLAEASLPLVCTVAQEFAGGKTHILDLIAAGNQALVEAVAGFEGEGDFQEYAEPKIHAAIKAAA